MNKKVKKVELVLRKINYLFDSIESNPLQSSNLEMALLKRYAVDLYDTILEFEESETWDVKNTHELLEEKVEEIKEEVVGEEETVLEVETPKVEEKSATSMATKLGFGSIGAGIIAGGSMTEENIKEEVTEDLTNILEEAKKREAEEQEREEVETIEMEEEPVFEERMEEEVFQEEEVLEEEPIEEETIMEEEEKMLMEEETPPIIEEEVLETDTIGRPTERIFGLEDKPVQEEHIQEENYEPIQDFVEEEPDENLEGKNTEVLNDVYANVQSDSQIEIEPASNSGIATTEESNELNNVFKQGQKKFSISFNQRFAFISELFGGDAAVYEHTLEELGKCANVIEAFTYLNLHVKLKYQWKDDSETTKEFQKIVKDSFLSET